MECSIKLAGWVLDDPVFYGLKTFKLKLVFPIMFPSP